MASPFVRPIAIGALQLPSNVLFAPLAGCSDFPYRSMCRRFHPGLLFCEMVKMEAILRSDPSSFRMLHYTSDMHPIGAQLCGSRPELAGAAAKIIEDLGFDAIDLNCGCPVDKVIQDGSGSGLLKNPLVIGEILSNMVAAVRIPVTVKVRAGWDDKQIIIRDLVHIAEQAGVKAMTVHGRTRRQGYSGEANLDWILAAKQEAKSIKIFGNGDLFSADAAINMFEKTGCDGVMVARGGIGQPWIADDIVQAAMTGQTQTHSGAFKKSVLQAHYELVRDYGDDHQVVMDMRRVGCSYLGKLKGGRSFREVFSTVASLQEIEALIGAIPFEEGV